MAMSETVKQRIRDFLAHHDAGVRAEVLAYEALGLRGAVGAIADRVVRAAVAGDPGFVCDSGGMWYLKSSVRETALREISFVCVGLVPSADAEVHALAGRKVQVDGREAPVSPGADSPGRACRDVGFLCGICQGRGAGGDFNGPRFSGL